MYKKGYWYDGCEHGEDCYVGSFSINNHKYDVHYFSNGAMGMEVCIRYGAEDHEYICAGSMQTLNNIVKNWPDNTPYVVAYSMVYSYLLKD